MKHCTQLFVALVVVAVSLSTAHAQLYWDINGSGTGATDDVGGLAAGTWDCCGGSPADYNGDGVVDAADFVAWSKDPGSFGGDPGGYQTWFGDFGEAGGGGGTSNWSTDATGASATVGWTPGQTAVFSAGGNATGNYTVTLSGAQTAGGITFDEGSVTLSGDQLNLTDAGTITTSTGTTSTINSVVGGSVALTKAGADRLLLTGANVYTGGTNVDVGTLQFGNTTAMPASGGVTVANGATLSVNAGGVGEWTNAASGGGSIGGLIAGTGGQGTLNQITWADGSAMGIDTANAGGALSYSGVIGSFRAASGTTNAVGLTKRGTGTLSLSGANTYTGATTMATNSGIIKAVATNTLPAATVVTLPASNGSARVELFAGSSSSSGDKFDQTIAGLSGGGSGTTSPTVVDVGYATLTVDVPSGQSYRYDGYLKTEFTDPATRGKVIKKGQGDLTLGGLNNNFALALGMAGEFSMEEGRLIYVNNVGTGGNDATRPSQLTLKGGTIVKNLATPGTSMSVTPRTLEIAGSFSFDMNGSTGNAQFLPSAPAGGLGGINLTVNNPTISVNNGVIQPNATTALPFTPTFILSGIITDGANSFGFTKAGAGTLTLDRVNAYDGTTTVAEGVLRVTAAVGSANTLISTIGNGTTSPIVLSGGSLEYTGALINGTRVGTIDNPVTMTSSSGISHNTGSGAGGLGPTVDFLFSNFTATAGTLTLSNNGASNEPTFANPYANPLEFRVGFTGTGFDFTQPVIVQNHTNPLVPNRTTSLMSSNTTGSQTFSGLISGNGGYVRNGAGGESILTASNTYTGDTKVLAGTLSITNPYLADTADVYLTAGSIFDLDFAVDDTTDTINQLFIDGAAQLTGTWGGIGSGAANETALITGGGWLLVTAMGSGGGGAVPEPGTLALAVMAIFAMSGGCRRG